MIRFGIALFLLSKGLFSVEMSCLRELLDAPVREPARLAMYRTGLNLLASKDLQRDLLTGPFQVSAKGKFLGTGIRAKDYEKSARYLENSNVILVTATQEMRSFLQFNGVKTVTRVSRSDLNRMTGPYQIIVSETPKANVIQRGIENLAEGGWMHVRLGSMDKSELQGHVRRQRRQGGRLSDVELKALYFDRKILEQFTELAKELKLEEKGLKWSILRQELRVVPKHSPVKAFGVRSNNQMIAVSSEEDAALQTEAEAEGQPSEALMGRLEEAYQPFLGKTLVHWTLVIHKPGTEPVVKPAPVTESPIATETKVLTETQAAAPPPVEVPVPAEERSWLGWFFGY